MGFAMQGEASLENGSAATDVRQLRTLFLIACVGVHEAHEDSSEAVAAILATIVELDAALGSSWVT